MELDANIADLIGVLEYKIGSQTYNPNSYNGWTGEEGCGFRYPVSYCRNKDDFEGRKLIKTKTSVEHLEPECVGTMKYAFGSNHLYIGDGLVEVLEYLEEIYGINFNELEEKRTENRKRELLKIQKKLDDGDTIKVDAGTIKIGLDIPAGKYTIINPKEGYSTYLSLDIRNVNGDRVDYFVTSDDYTDIDFAEGYIIKSYDVYSLKKSEDTSK